MVLACWLTDCWADHLGDFWAGVGARARKYLSDPLISSVNLAGSGKRRGRSIASSGDPFEQHNHDIALSASYVHQFPERLKAGSHKRAVSYSVPSTRLFSSFGSSVKSKCWLTAPPVTGSTNLSVTRHKAMVCPKSSLNTKSFPGTSLRRSLGTSDRPNDASSAGAPKRYSSKVADDCRSAR